MLRVTMVMVTVLMAGTAFADGEACTSNDQCAATERCDTERAGACDAAGTCVPRGINLMCVTTCDAVCGCDGKTYLNACYAHKAGASVAQAGPCP